MGQHGKVPKGKVEENIENIKRQIERSVPVYVDKHGNLIKKPKTA